MMVACNFCHTEADNVMDRLYAKDGYPILRCSACKLVFRGTIPNNQELESIYSDEYFFSELGDTNAQGYQNYLKDEQFLRLNFRRRLRRISWYCSHSGHLLDVGSASGFFMDEARQLGWTVKGVEYSATMSRLAKEKLGLDVWTGKFQDFHDNPASCDVITMWDYIEHSVDPAKDIQAVRRMLKPGGLMVASTGDISSMMSKLSGQNWHLMTPRHHIFYFSPKVIRAYLEKEGFEVLKIAHHSEMYSFSYVSYKLFTIFPWRMVRAGANLVSRSPLARLNIPINLFDIMTIYARKNVS